MAGPFSIANCQITRGYRMFHDVSIVVEKDRNFSFLMRKPICLLISACWLCVSCFIHRKGADFRPRWPEGQISTSIPQERTVAPGPSSWTTRGLRRERMAAPVRRRAAASSRRGAKCAWSGRDLVWRYLGGFLSHRGTPSYHPFIDGMFYEINHLFWVPPLYGNPYTICSDFLCPEYGILVTAAFHAFLQKDFQEC